MIKCKVIKQKQLTKKKSGFGIPQNHLWLCPRILSHLWLGLTPEFLHRIIVVKKEWGLGSQGQNFHTQLALIIIAIVPPGSSVVKCQANHVEIKARHLPLGLCAKCSLWPALLPVSFLFLSSVDRHEILGLVKCFSNSSTVEIAFLVENLPNQKISHHYTILMEGNERS